MVKLAIMTITSVNAMANPMNLDVIRIYLPWTTENQHEKKGDLYEFECANGNDKQTMGWMRYGLNEKGVRDWYEISEERQAEENKEFFGTARTIKPCPKFPSVCNPYDMQDHEAYKPWKSIDLGEGIVVDGDYHFYCTHKEHDPFNPRFMRCDSKNGWEEAPEGDEFACPHGPNTLRQ